VPVGELSNVQLKNGRAVITMKIRRKYAHVYTTPPRCCVPRPAERHGRRAHARHAPRRRGRQQQDVIRSRRRCPTSTPTSSWRRWTATRAATCSFLVAGGGEALGGNGKNLSATFRRLEPTTATS